MASLIQIFDRDGFNFQPPEEVKLAAKEFLGENDIVSQFMTATYEITTNPKDTVKFTDVWKDFKTCREFFDQLGIKQS